MYTEEKLRELLDEVIDPEIGIGLNSLGLIYKVMIDFNEQNTTFPESTEVTMTFTSPFCPFADAIIEQVESAVTLGGFGDPKVTITFDPPWQAPAQLRSMLGM